MSKFTYNQCRVCGGDLIKDTKSDKYICKYCGNMYTLNENNVLQQITIKDLDDQRVKIVDDMKVVVNDAIEKTKNTYGKNQEKINKVIAERDKEVKKEKNKNRRHTIVLFAFLGFMLFLVVETFGVGVTFNLDPEVFNILMPISGAISFAVIIFLVILLLIKRKDGSPFKYLLFPVIIFCAFSFSSFISIPINNSLIILPWQYSGDFIEFVVPSHIKAISKHAFYWGSLEKITIPKSVVFIDHDAFDGYSIKSVYYEGTIEDWLNIDFDGSNSLLSNTDLYINGEKVVDLVIPYGITTISDYAFSRCQSLESITISDSVKEIGSGAFDGCPNLKSVYYEGSVEYWVNIDFGWDNSLLSNGADLYINGEKVVDLVIPYGITTISDYAFYGCQSLESVTISDSVKEIGSKAFYGCPNLKSVYYEGSVEYWVNIDFGWDNSLLSNGDLYINGEKVVDLVIPYGITTISDYAFSGCQSLESVTISDSVKEIGWAFSGCPNLKSVYYEGSEKYWIYNDLGNTFDNNVSVYYYTETQPTEKGNFWHYVNGKPTIWD